ncbi:hypothetical protein [Sinisalibacter lacisalsi]|uniref:DUF1849 family protein n=1 Tax=Sinisalibacter lacisalsi TaxID=1526570 RepID=A0ABQ1QM07_9RHOB|nr:hypothetical protein [Sinisalibacter lacisalsi]GGD30792.1 hypothetical protein GCM10011358_13540 [Sinisalibacter lacisalsi]
MFRTAHSLLAGASILCATAASAESITCAFTQQTDTTTLNVTISGEPGTATPWIWHATMLQDSEHALYDGTWAGAARDVEDFLLAQLRVDVIEYQGETASSVEILTGGLVVEPLPIHDFEALTAEAQPVWGRLTMPINAKGLFNPVLAEGVMEPMAFGPGVFPVMWQGSIAAAPGTPDFAATPETLLAIENFRAPATRATLSIYPIRDPENPKPTEHTIALAEFRWNEGALKETFTWVDRELPGYLALFRQGCPDNRQQ